MKLSKQNIRFDLIVMSGLFALALIVRLLFIFSSHGDVVTPDGALYGNIATHLLQGEGFIQDARSYPIVVPPFYPIFLALIYAIFGVGNSTAVLVIQAILGALTVVFVYETAKELFNRWAGLFAGLLFSIYSVSIYWTGFVLTETLFTFLVVVFTYVLARLLRSKATYWTAGLLGLIWGITCLTRPHLLFFIPFLWVLLFIVQKRRGLKLAGISTLLLLMTIIPWIGYLYAEYGCVIPIASHGGIALWCGNGPFVNPNRYYSSTRYANDPLFAAQLKEGMSLPLCEQDRFFRNIALRFIISHPLRFVDNTYRKFILFAKPVNLRMKVFGISVLDKITNTTDTWLLVLSLLGFIFSLFPKQNFKRNQTLLWLILYYSLIVSVNIIVSQGRYRLPAMPLVAIYTGLATSQCIHGVSKVIEVLRAKMRRP